MKDEKLREWEQNTKWYKKLSKLFKEDDVFWNNEIAANMFVSTCLLILAVVLVLSFFLAYVGVFDVPLLRMANVLVVNIPLLFIGIVISAFFKGQKHWIKYVLCIISISVSIGLCSIISIFVPLIICIPVALSSRYYSRRFTNTVYLFTVLGMVVSEIINSLRGMVDLNLVKVPYDAVLTIDEGGLREAVLHSGYDYSTYLTNLFRGSFMPKLLLLSILAFICQELARRANEMVLAQAEISQRTESVRAELEMATNIQTAVLPKSFPAFPSRPDLDICASMDPAKEVGGDFYDYYLLDDDHLLLVIADVSGKSVPAALFMMISKVLIKTYADIYKTPAAIATAVNKRLCERNEAEMFVTAWIGILEISTGIMTAVDAGHQYPVLLREGGKYELIKGKKSFVLAGMEGTEYKEYSFDFKRGDKLFLYTDGVSEAENCDNELYGTDRLLDVLNKNKDADSENILIRVREDVDAFVQDAPQFDDLTMVSMFFRKEEKQITVPASNDSVASILAFVEENIAVLKPAQSVLNQINVTIDEIVSNIVNYAYKDTKGDVTLILEINEALKTVTLTFVDSGIPYNPLEKEDPDVTLSASEREIGGLGIFIVKKYMDDIEYSYEDGKNILTITKKCM